MDMLFKSLSAFDIGLQCVVNKWIPVFQPRLEMIPKGLKIKLVFASKKTWLTKNGDYLSWIELGSFRLTRCQRRVGGVESFARVFPVLLT